MEILLLGGLACLVVGLLKLLNWQRDQGAIADAQLDAGDVGGSLGTSAGVFVVSALFIVAVCVLFVLSQGGQP